MLAEGVKAALELHWVSPTESEEMNERQNA